MTAGMKAMASSALVLPLAGCAALDHGFLAAAGPVAAGQRHLFLVVAGILMFVAVPVLILVPLFAWHYRRSNKDDAYRPKWAFSWPLEGLIWLPPTGIVILLAVLLWPATQEADPYRPLPDAGPPLRVQAIGLDWKWVFIYPDQGIATVNMLPLPAGRPVALELTSGTVMQSLLLPRLAGQVYAMAGMTTRLHFAADTPGRYLGENTQFNGKRFAQQRFTVTALPADEFAAWVKGTRRSAPPLDEQSWSALSRRGTAASASFAAVPPDLFRQIVSDHGGMSHPHSHAHGKEPR